MSSLVAIIISWAKALGAEDKKKTANKKEEASHPKFNAFITSSP
jgi:hypothetical protein